MGGDVACQSSPWYSSSNSLDGVCVRCRLLQIAGCSKIKIRVVSVARATLTRHSYCGSNVDPIRLHLSLALGNNFLLPCGQPSTLTRRSKLVGCRLRTMNTPLGTLLSIRDAVFTVPPKSWKRDFSPRRTPPVTCPLWRPTRSDRSPVPSPRNSSKSSMLWLILSMQSLANFAIIAA